jgi:hypothetical protein
MPAPALPLAEAYLRLVTALPPEHLGPVIDFLAALEHASVKEMNALYEKFVQTSTVEAS